MAETFMDSDEDWMDDDCDDEEFSMSSPTRCLFSDSVFPDPLQALVSARDSYSFNVHEFSVKFDLDSIGYIKFINYCRTKKPSPAELSQLTTVVWDSDEFMKPVLEDDGLLMFDVDDLEQLTSGGVGDGPASAGSCGSDAGMIAQCHAAEARARHAEESLNRLAVDVEKMREMASALVLSAAAEPRPSHEAIANLQEDDDDLYFGSYAHFGIHQEMLQDRVRTESYRDAIYKNADQFKDKVVLDIGCGTGILSMFAARSGAKKVIGVDMSDIAFQAIDIVRENNLSDVITILKGRVEDIDLPVEKVDIIISEWMGYFLLYESMLDTVLYARDRWLAPGGVILPNRCNISLVALADTDMRSRNYTYWEDVYGFKMSCMQNAVCPEATTLVVDGTKVCTDAAQLTHIDISSCSTKDLEFTSPFTLTSAQDAEVTALVGYFDIWFDSFPNSVFFSTSPKVTPTHWRQTVFLLEETIPMKKDEVLEGQLICRKNHKDPRSLKITISLRGRNLVYHMQ